MPTSRHHLLNPETSTSTCFRGCNLSLVTTTILNPENEQRVLVFGVAASLWSPSPPFNAHQLPNPKTSTSASFRGCLWSPPPPSTSFRSPPPPFDAHKPPPNPETSTSARFRGCDLSLVATTPLDLFPVAATIQPRNEHKRSFSGLRPFSGHYHHPQPLSGCRHHPLMPSPETSTSARFRGCHVIRILFVNNLCNIIYGCK